MKKLISYLIIMTMLCQYCVIAGAESTGEIVFKHQNVVGSQTCYGDDTEEKTITQIPDVVQGMRINQPVFRVYMGTTVAGNVFTVKQML